MTDSVTRRPASAALLAAGVVLVVGGCGLPRLGGGSDATESASLPATVTVTVAPSSSASATGTSAPTAGSTLAPTEQSPGPIDKGDYEDGLRYDFGEISSVTKEGDTTALEFNRMQLHVGDDLQSGTQFSKEPIVYGNSDVPYVDDSKKLRRYVLAPGVEVLRLADPVPCAGSGEVREPVWKSIGEPALRRGAYQSRTQVALTFDESGRVSRVRLSSSC